MSTASSVFGRVKLLPLIDTSRFILHSALHRCPLYDIFCYISDTVSSILGCDNHQNTMRHAIVHRPWVPSSVWKNSQPPPHPDKMPQ